MSSSKRHASPGLVGRPSPYNPSVTLFDPKNNVDFLQSIPDTPRRSKRLRLAKENEVAGQDHLAASMTTSHRGKTPTAATSSTVAEEPAIRPSVTRTPAKVKGQASPRKPKVIPQTLATPHPAPPRWREAYDRIKDMRSRIVAPVDTMGCGRAQLEETVPKNQRFATLVSLMLSSQTKDEVTSAAVTKLREAVGGSLSVDAILQADEDTISEAICKVGFWRRKTQYIKRTAQCLHDDFDSDVPKTVDELCSLPGVGPKMAILALHVGWKVNAGVGVDVHVHRITNRLGWHNPPTKTPEETRLNLQSWLPLELRPTFTGLLVGFGQTICLPVGPRCDSCQLSDGLCPSARVSASRTGKKIHASNNNTGPKLEIAVEEEEGKSAIKDEDTHVEQSLFEGLPSSIKVESQDACSPLKT